MDNEFKAFLARIDAIAPTLATKADIEALRLEMRKMSVDGFGWMVASLVGMFVGFVGLYFAASDATEPQPQVVSIIIYVTPQK